MKDIFLYGHSGSVNRGAEAIVKSTADLLHDEGCRVVLSTQNAADEEAVGHAEFDEVVATRTPFASPLGYAPAYLKSLISRGEAPKYAFAERGLRAAARAAVVLTVGGDTYGYGLPLNFQYNNCYCNENRIPNYLWGCSIGEEDLNAEVLEDLRRYTTIFPREETTMAALRAAGLLEEKLHRMSDPAFTLAAEPFGLPPGFDETNTVGLNVSNLAVERAAAPAGAAGWYADFLARLLAAGHRVALIPHVYAKKGGDLEILARLYAPYEKDDRVICFGEGEPLNCRQLKYLVSKCRFVVTARTHLSIAAYSSMVPALVLGYSVKSVGIARELFGTDEGWVLPVQGLCDGEQLVEAFEALVAQEAEAKKILVAAVPKCQRLACDAARRVAQAAKGEDNGR